MQKLASILSLLFLLHISAMLKSSPKEFIITEFGAIGDGITLNTKAIQKAIDQANNLGGGIVIIPKGRFLSGSIILKSNVELFLKNKAILLGSKNPKDYIKINRWKALIMADSANNIKISGKGTIDGQGAPLALHIDSLFYIGELDSSLYVFPEMRPSVTIRPQIIEFVNCRNAIVEGVTIMNSASWVQSYYMCNNLKIDNIRVESDTYWNNDGIDIIDCHNVQITNSYFNASDDGICIKSYGRVIHNFPICDSIYVSNCTVRSSASAVKLGTASFGGFKNIWIENIKVFDTFRSAIALESYGRGFLENVHVNNIKAKNTANAIFIRIGKKRKNMNMGILKNVSIKNIKVQIPFGSPDINYKIRGPQLPFSHNVFPSSITGVPSQKVENVIIENVKITYPGKGDKSFAYAPLARVEDIPEKIEKYPEFSMFGELPAWGFYVRHVNGITFKDIKLKIKKPDYRPAFVFDDVENLELEEIKILGDKKKPFFFHNTPFSEN